MMGNVKTRHEGYLDITAATDEQAHSARYSVAKHICCEI